MQTDKYDSSIYRRRLDTLAEKIDGGVAIIFSATHATRSNDTTYPFRQNSNFFYLTGFPEEDAVLVVTTKKGTRGILFVQNKDPQHELWEGKRFGPEAVAQNFVVDHAFGIDQFQSMLPEIIAGHDSLYVDMFGQEREYSQKVYPILKDLNHKKKSKAIVPQQVLDLAHIVGKMRLIKDEHEIKLMQKACDISAKAHRAAMAYASPQRYEYQVQALMEFIFKSSGANGAAYDSIVAGGDNANTLHYITNRDPLSDGEHLLIDAGCELGNYASDITRTFPINGKFSAPAAKVYQIVLDAQKMAIEMVRPGETLTNIHRKTTESLIRGLIELKVLSADPQEIFDHASYKDFFPHGTGHWLGLDVHDTCPYLEGPKDSKTEELHDITLAPGMVLTVEPGLYFSKHYSDIPEEFKGIGVRIEDDILVTEQGHRNLSADVPKEISEVEKACQEDYRSFL